MRSCGSCGAPLEDGVTLCKACGKLPPVPNHQGLEPRRSTWELWILSVLFIPAFVSAFHDRREGEFSALLSVLLALCLVGLWKRWRWAWWVVLLMTVLWGFFGVSNIFDYFENYGYNRRIRLPYGVVSAATGLAGTVFLFILRLRGGYGDGARVVWGEFPSWRVVVPLLVMGFFAFFLAPLLTIPGYVLSRWRGGERNASSTLKTLATAQADFRANDRDGNRVNDFWTGDVAGLYLIKSRYDEEERMIKLIELSVAGADSDPLPIHRDRLAGITVAMPKSGHWFWALPEDASVDPPRPYRQDTEGIKPLGAYYNTSRFGFLVYPARFTEAGRSVYIINEGNTLYRGSPRPAIVHPETLPPGPVTEPGYTSWPGEEDLKTRWSKLD